MILSKQNLLDQGFKIFFLGAALYSFISILIWLFVYALGLNITTLKMSSYQWHSHEMLYGYCMAVIAGFLLTAVQNWTQRKTASGNFLLFLFSLWLLARILFHIPEIPLEITATLEISFATLLIFCIARPIIEIRQWKQLGILSKLVLLLIGNVLFYLGIIINEPMLTHWSIYGGLFLVIGLILTIARRVFPIFLENGIGYPIKIKNYKLVDFGILFCFLAFFVCEVFFTKAISLLPLLSLILFALTSIRLYCWYAKGIWKKDLLWSFYLAILAINLGFLLFFSSYVLGTSKFIALHAFSYAGIGLITLSMMARVILGHTGRSIHHPPKNIKLVFFLILIGSFFRVIAPLVSSHYYVTWIITAQLFWLAAFGLFIIIYTPIIISQNDSNLPKN